MNDDLVYHGPSTVTGAALTAVYEGQGPGVRELPHCPTILHDDNDEHRPACCKMEWGHPGPCIPDELYTSTEEVVLVSKDK